MQQVNTLFDIKRHRALFDTEAYAIPLHVVGVGGVGSHLLYNCGHMGVGQNPNCVVSIYDDDVVEAHNPPSQSFESRHVGQLKVAALSEQYGSWSNGVIIKPHPIKVRDNVAFSGVVCLCLDSMEDRKHILDNLIWGNPDVQMVIETRMDATLAKVHVMNPMDPRHRKIWDTYYWYSDNETENGLGCDGHLSIVTATGLTGILAAEQLKLFASLGSAREMPNEVSVNMRNWSTVVRHWSTLVLDDE